MQLTRPFWLYFRPEAWYAEQGVRLVLGTRADRIDRDARTVSAGGETVAYDTLVLSTGSVPHRLPGRIGGDLPGVEQKLGEAGDPRSAPEKTDQDMSEAVDRQRDAQPGTRAQRTMHIA